MLELTKVQESLVTEDLFEADTEEMYEESLNETFGMADVCGHEYPAGQVLREVDPIMFRCGLADWVDSELGESLVEVDGNYYNLADVHDLLTESMAAIR